MNKELSELPYNVKTGKLTLTKVQEISVNGTGNYYLKGSIEMEFENLEATPTNLSVKVDFEGIPIGFTNVGAAKK